MELLHILHLGFPFWDFMVIKKPGPMELLRILHLGFAFRVYIGYKIPRPHGTTTHTSFRVSMKGLHGLQNPPAPWNYYAYFI